MKFIKKLFIVTMCISLLLANSNMSFAHSGRTDSSGGHHDYRNVSGLGSYHYHCGGNPAHLHKNGVCPYSSAAKSSSSKSRTTAHRTSKYYTYSTIKKVQTKLNNLGYKCGTADGVYGTKTKKAIKKYQKKKGMSANGNINKSLVKKLHISI
jgi:hypothetical protein